MPSQRIVRVFGCSVSLKSYQKEQRSLSPTDMTAATPLNKVSLYEVHSCSMTLSIGYLRYNFVWAVDSILASNCVAIRSYSRIKCEGLQLCTSALLSDVCFVTNCRYSLMLLDYKPVQHVIVLNTVGNCNKIVL